MNKTGLAMLAMSVMAGAIPGARAAEPSVDAQTSDVVAIELIQSPKITRFPTGNVYPIEDVYDGREGWVIMTIMVDSTARPVDAMINDSSGNPAFERAALNAVKLMTFEPARRSGAPVDGSIRFKMRFSVTDLAKGARPAFAAAYQKFMQAIKSQDKPRADAQLVLLKPRNLYEEAFASFGKYYYDVAWGTKDQQREDLSAAIAGERQPKYLPKENFVTALYMKFKLEIESSEYGSALDTWEVLEPLADADMHAKVQKLVDQIHAIQAGNQSTRITAVIGDRGRWSTSLLRNRFHVVVKDGTIRDVQLTCARKIMSFKFDPGMEYSIGPDKDRCQAALLGQPGTSFEFNQ